MPIDPFKSTAYQVGRIVRALTSDSAGNLIFRDVPNPDGVTLTELLKGLIGSNISFDSDGTFYDGANNIQDALEYLNQFAYLKYNSRFIYVDPTIPDTFVVIGEIYNDLEEAVAYANTLTYNGYNKVNLMIMGSHRQSAADATTDLGVFEFDASTPITLNKNGLNFIGVGNPVFRITDTLGTASVRSSLFSVDTNIANDVSILFQDISFEFVNSAYTSVFSVANAPISNSTKERSGLKIVNATISFIGGSNQFNRFIDFTNTGPTQKVSEIMVDGFKLGNIFNVTPSTNPIELFRINHHANSLITLKDFSMAGAEQPNPSTNTDTSKITNFVAIKAESGKVIISDLLLDEKFYWNGTLQAGVSTKLLNASGANTKVSIFNAGIVRDSYNTQNEDSSGMTLIKDWITVDSLAKVNVVGSFDERYDIDVQDVGVTIGTSGTGTTPGFSVKPVKSFWNKDEIVFGLGNRNEVRFGIPSSSDISTYLSKYDISEYGVPFWYNAALKQFQYFDGETLRTVGEGSGSGLGESTTITVSEWASTSYVFNSGPTFLGFEYIWTHNLGLNNMYAFSYTLFDTDNGNQVQAQQIIPISANSVKIIVASPLNANFTLVGF